MSIGRKAAFQEEQKPSPLAVPTIPHNFRKLHQIELPIFHILKCLIENYLMLEK